MMGMYFKSRRAAGEELAVRLKHLRFENTVIIALTEGGVEVAEPIAIALHSTIWLMVSRPVNLPSSAAETIGSIVQDGSFVTNDSYSEAEAEEIKTEFHGFIEEEKLRQLHDINHLIGEVGIVSASVLKGHTVIAVSDGFASLSQLEALESFMKPINIVRLVAAVPLASVDAVDKMHILCDEIHCLNVLDNFLTVDHYYDETPPPTHEAAMTTIKNIITKWA